MTKITKSHEAEGKRLVGRPLSFDRGHALKRAMLVFWEYGFEGASVQMLIRAMGITPPSLYAAFGDKRQLFLEALNLYATGESPLETGKTHVRKIVETATTAREAVWELLASSAIALTGEDTPKGCMLVSSATNCSPEASDVQEYLARIRVANEEAVRSKIEVDIQKGLLPETAKAEALASLCMALIQGMSSQARDGATREKLLAMADQAMAAWPN